MIVTPIQTERVTSKSVTLKDLLLRSLPQLKDGDVLAVTSKIVSLCEGRTVPLTSTDKEALIVQESQLYTDPLGQYGFHFTVTNNTLIAAAGIDESNGGDNFVLWPADAQESAEEVWRLLREHFGIQNLGVVITDSTCKPLRRGVVGIALTHCGFAALNDYIGKPDLFGRPFKVSQMSVAEGLAAAAVLAMGEGSEQTPLCLLRDVPFVDFQDRPPTVAELETIYMPIEEDIFAPLIQAVEWHKGQKGARHGR